MLLLLWRLLLLLRQRRQQRCREWELALCRAQEHGPLPWHQRPCCMPQGLSCSCTGAQRAWLMPQRLPELALLLLQAQQLLLQCLQGHRLRWQGQSGQNLRRLM